MKILFIITPDNEEEKFKIKLSSGAGLYIPLGVARIVAILEKEKHIVNILDTRLYFQINNKLIFDKIKKFKPDIIGFPISLFSAKYILSISNFIKKHFDIPIILGGPYASIFLDNILKKNKSIDIVVFGEGYYTLLNIINHIKNNRSLNGVKGIIFRDKNGKIIKTKERPLIKNLDRLPFLALHHFDLNRYVPFPKNYKSLPILPMITSRGCPWGNCTFCYHPKKGEYYSKQSPKRVIEEIKYFIKRNGIKEVVFFDDSFIDDEKWIMKFCELIKKERIKIQWGCNTRVSQINKKIIEKIAEAGCWQLMYGIESGNQETLNKIKKGITLEQARKAIKMTKKAGIEVRTAFMLGFPWETPEMTDKTIKFALELDANYGQFTLVTPYPGTEMYENLKKSRRLDKKIDNYCEYKAVFLPKNYKNKKELEKKFKYAYRKFYLNPRYFFRSIKKIKSFTDVKRYSDGLKVVLNFLINKKDKT